MATSEKNTGLWIGAIVVGIVVMAMWRFAPSLIPCLLRLQLQSPASGISIDDVFSILNTLFSGLAFVGVVVAIFLQRRELQLQREELEETREELKGQKDALLKQNELFTLANVHQTLVPILLEYRSAEMHSAINAPWKLHEDHPNDLVAAYERECRKGSPLPDQRRLVQWVITLTPRTARVTAKRIGTARS